MLSTLNTTEILQTTGATLADPHRILGMHEIATDGTTKLYVRAFLPTATGVTVLDPTTQDHFPLTKIHADGFYEGEITDRTKWFRYLLKIEFENGESFTTHDPYSFAPVLTDYDIFLFGQGTHYKIADKLGANVMTVDGIDGVLFALWAPNAARVSVVGSFNNYDGRRHVMRLRQNGIWELFIPGLKQYDRYKYEIKTRDGVLLQKSDPYAKFNELRPSTNSLIYDITKYKWNDEAWLAARNANHPLSGPINIYEVNLGSWKKNPANIREGDDSGGFMTYTELAHELVPYAVEMGYTHLELMPIQEHPYDGSWGYQLTGYYAPTSRYGSPDEFKYFIDYCHQHGLGVILDWVPAHFPKDAHGLEKFDGTALYEHEDPRQGEHPDWGTLVFNYGRQEVKNFLIANALFWIEEYHLDGLRVDAVASMLYLNYSKKGEGDWIANRYGGHIDLDALEFIKHMNSVISGAYPHVLMIAEESTSFDGVSRHVDHDGLGFNLKWNMGWMNDFLAYMERDPIYRRYHHNFLTFGMMYAYSENFVLVLSHDEVVHGKKSLLNKMPGDLWQKFANLRVALGFMYGHPGKKLLFMGGEFGQFIEWDEKRPLDWFLLEHDHHRQMQQFTKDLNHLYKTQRACWFDDFAQRGFSWVDVHDHARSIISFARFSDDPNDTLIFICNFTPNPIEEHRVGLHHAATYTEILNSDHPKYGGSGVINTAPLVPAEILCNNLPKSIGLRLPPLGVVILKPLTS